MRCNGFGLILAFFAFQRAGALVFLLNGVECNIVVCAFVVNIYAVKVRCLLSKDEERKK